MSARWRRNKKALKKLKIFKVFNKARERDIPRSFRAKKLGENRHRIKYKMKKIDDENLKAPPPLVDVLEENDEIAVFAEFAGFSKDNLKINVKNQRLTLSAKTSDRTYRKSLNLPKRVIPDTICTTHKNGVLEIRLKKALQHRQWVE